MSQMIHSMPLWFGWFLIILAMFLAYPAVGNIIESNNDELWKSKVTQMGITYSTGSLFWSYLSLIVQAFFIGTGVQVIRNKDTTTPD
jgi:hypothetical protein